MKWRVWITGYPGSYVDVEEGAYPMLQHPEAAMRVAAAEFKACHHGEIVEINAQQIPIVPTLIIANLGETPRSLELGSGMAKRSDYGVIHRLFVRLGPSGKFEVVR